MTSAVLWSIWLALNEWIFQSNKINQDDSACIIKFRSFKWLVRTNLLNKSHVSLWLVNPIGTVTLHSHTFQSNFWNSLFGIHDLICSVDGSFYLNSSHSSCAGI